MNKTISANISLLYKFIFHVAMVTLLAICPAAPHFVFAVPASNHPPLFGMPGDGDEDEDDDVRFQTVSRLTLSFAEDGTSIARFKSSLFTSFSDLLTREELENLVLEAFQIWAQHSAINVGLVSDSGEEFGIGGLSQGDLRFGDIRVGAVPMAGDVFAVAVPNIDFVSGTWTGDLLFNSNADFETADQFFAVALHEAGHVLGLGHTEDVTSVMHPTALNDEPNADDIAGIKLLYGERIDLDPNEDLDDPDHEENIDNDAHLAGEIPLVVFGDIEHAADVDLFKFESEFGHNEPITFRLISDSVSLLNATMTVFDESGNFVGSDSGNSDRGINIFVTLNDVDVEDEYTIRIESIGDAENRFGSYALVTTWDEHVPPENLALVDIAIRRNYAELSQDELQDLLQTGLEGPIAEVLPNDTVASATILLPRENIALYSLYRIQTGIADFSDIDFYQVQAFDSTMSVSVNALLDATGQSGLISNLSVLDNTLQPVAGCEKVNGNGQLLVEYTNLVVGGDYFIGVAADRPEGEFGTGNYDLNVAFDNLDRELELLASGQMIPGRPSRSHSLYVARSQLFHFALAGLERMPPSEATLWMSIYDEAGELKFRVATRPGEFRTAKSVVLTPGSYSIRMHLSFPAAIGTALKSGAPPMITRYNGFGYQVFGIGISEPTGPEIIDPSQDPFAPCDKMTSDFCYPNNRFSPDPFIVVEQDEVPLPASVPNPPWQDINIWYWFG